MCITIATLIKLIISYVRMKRMITMCCLMMVCTQSLLRQKAICAQVTYTNFADGVAYV